MSVQIWEVGGDENLIVRYVLPEDAISIIRYDKDDGYVLDGITLSQKELQNIIVLLETLVRQ